MNHEREPLKQQQQGADKFLLLLFFLSQEDKALNFHLVEKLLRGIAEIAILGCCAQMEVAIQGKRDCFGSSQRH